MTRLEAVLEFIGGLTLTLALALTFVSVVPVTRMFPQPDRTFVPSVALDATQVTDRRWPVCPEDAVLVGSGDYTAGHWTTYTCGPAVDDFGG